MHVLVRLLNRFSKSLTYFVPDELASQIDEGVLVQVPLRSKMYPAIVVDPHYEVGVVSYQILPIHKVLGVPADSSYHAFVRRLSQYYFVEPLYFHHRLASFIAHEEVVEELSDEAVLVEHPSLTAEQRGVVEAIWSDADQQCFAPTLLQGVTGSGKTEVYKELIARWCAAGKTVIFLCPEVSLAQQMQRRFSLYFGDRVLVGGWHTHTTRSERRCVWQWACQGKPSLIVGVHVPVLMPLSNLGGIIVDEEHEQGYEDMSPHKINTKHVALLRAREYKVPIILGSATPSVATLHWAREHGWRHCRLTTRFGGAFPQITHVLLSNKEKRPHFWVSHILLDALADTVFRGQQAIIFLNRRGYSFFMQCVGCGFIFQCSQCSVSLTVHEHEHAGGVEQELRCHYCEYSMPLPRSCPDCGASMADGLYKGTGTQQLVGALKKLLPGVRIARADADVSRRKREWDETIRAFEAREIDVLVGTQIVAKGLDFPAVTLVGVIWGDASVHFPSYNAHEVALQQLIQVAGRAGRRKEGGRVIIQSFDNHSLFAYASEDRYEEFCARELEDRRELGYPPFRRMVTIQLSNAHPAILEREAGVLAQALRSRAGVECAVLGPARPLVDKVKGMCYRTILCKAEAFSVLHALIDPLLWKDFNSTVIVCPQ